MRKELVNYELLRLDEDEVGGFEYLDSHCSELDYSFQFY